MHPLIEQAKTEIRCWSSNDPQDLAVAVASLCSHILEMGSLPEGDQDWQRLRQSFEIERGQPIAATVASWDDQCRLGDFDISNHDLYVKLGIVTWSVKKLLKQLGMLTGPIDPPMPLEAWKANLIDCLDRFIIVGEQRTSRQTRAADWADTEINGSWPLSDKPTAEPRSK